MLSDQLQRLGAITGFGDNLQFRKLPEERANSTSDDSVVGSDQNPNFLHSELFPL
jgi:hypothetical protein